MSIRATVTATWTQIGTGPATVELISPSGGGVEVMIACQTATPTGADGMVLNGDYPAHTFTESDAIWAATVQGGSTTALVAVQPEVIG
jgi:hypothetical protein